ncbi:MAG: SprB repeat-containing protein, partial [Bacteroidales bacterium]|nr:SprB repeat-containing protein [Bacteroidales bacterium]
MKAQDITITDITTTPVTCGGGSDGTITVTITGGNGLYKYLLVRAGVPVENVGPIAAQNYTFTGHDKFSNYIIIVSDQDDETADAISFATIDGPDPISITSYGATDITCNNVNDGTV